MRKTIVLVGMAALAAASSAWAATIVVEQRGRAFSEREITIKAGDEVSFVNNDSYGHNVYSETEGAVFDIGLQDPGETLKVSFKDPAIVEVRCRIHPRMRLTINVVE